MISLGIWNNKTRVDLHQKWWTSSNPSRLCATQSVSSSCHAFVWSLQSGFSNLDYFGRLLESTLRIGTIRQFGDILTKPNLLASSQVDHYSVKNTYGNTSPRRDVNGFAFQSIIQSFQSFWGGFLCDYLWLWCLAYAASVLSGWTHLHQICQQ